MWRFYVRQNVCKLYIISKFSYTLLYTYTLNRLDFKTLSYVGTEMEKVCRNNRRDENSPLPPR